MTLSAKNDGTITQAVSANTNYDIELPTYGKHYTIAWVIPAGLTAATFTFSGRAVGSDTYEAIVDSSNAQITMDVTSPATLRIVDTVCDRLRIAVTGIAGSGDVLITPTVTD